MTSVMRGKRAACLLPFQPRGVHGGEHRAGYGPLLQVGQDEVGAFTKEPSHGRNVVRGAEASRWWPHDWTVSSGFGDTAQVIRWGHAHAYKGTSSR